VVLDELTDAALLVDALCHDFPIVGAADGFCEIFGRQRRELLGVNCRVLLQGVPEVAVSKSARKNISNFCSMCRVIGLKEIAHTSAVQPNSHGNGKHFVNFFMLGLCTVHRHPFILGVQLPVGDGLFLRMSQREAKQCMEKARTIFKRVQAHLIAKCGSAPSNSHLIDDSSVHACCRQAIVAEPDFAFFAERLQDHCLLVNNGFTAVRREPEELAFNCMVFGDRPVRCSPEGLSFTVLVDDVTPTFNGLPVLGFTSRQPVDKPELYPVVSRCLGASVLIGACGEAFARDKTENFEMGFKPPPKSELQTWALNPDVPSHKRSPPVQVQPGDLLQCVYLREGILQMWRNDDKILEFNVERPIDESTDYYAVVDVCFSTYSLTVMPSFCDNCAGFDPDKAQEQPHNCSEVSTSTLVSTHPSGSRQSSEASDISTGSVDFDGASRFGDVNLAAVVNEVVIKQTIKAAVADCKFMVTIADPRGSDTPLIAVSEEFETMTGFERSEILGVNCRFLNQGVEMDPETLMNLRISSKTGVPFTAVIPNRKKSGELFLNLLDLRGLTVARSAKTGEDLWFLIGIQADVTDLADEEVPIDHLTDLQVLADGIRQRVAKELSKMAITGAVSTSGELPPMSQEADPEKKWLFLNEPCWRSGPALGSRSPFDSPAMDLLATVKEELHDTPASTALPPGSMISSTPSNPASIEEYSPKGLTIDHATSVSTGESTPASNTIWSDLLSTGPTLVITAGLAVLTSMLVFRIAKHRAA